MKKILSILLANLIIPISMLNTSIKENTFYVNDKCDNSDLTQEELREMDLSKFKMPYTWDKSNIAANNINVNYKDLDGNYSTDNYLLTIFKMIDNKFKDDETALLPRTTTSANVFTDFSVLLTVGIDYDVTVKDHSSSADSDYKFDKGKIFENLSVPENRIYSYSLCFTNLINHSYFNFSLNICNFDTSGNPIFLASKEQNLHTNIMPSTSVNSTDPNQVDDGGQELYPSSEPNNDIEYSSHKSYGLNIHKTDIHDQKYTYQYESGIDQKTGKPYYGETSWKWEGTKEQKYDLSGKDSNNKYPYEPGEFSLKYFCPEFTNWNIASHFLGNISYKYDWNVNPSTLTHKIDIKGTDIKKWNVNDIDTLDNVINNKNYFWNKTENQSPTSKNIKEYEKTDFNKSLSNYKTYISNSCKEQDFSHSQMHYAAFTVACRSADNSMIEIQTIYESQLNGHLWASMSLYPTINSTYISYTYNSSVFANNPNK